eukprot:558999-Prymnesium_polylepis.1
MFGRPIRALAASPEGGRFASGGDDGAALLWSDQAVRLRRLDLSSALSPLLDAYGRPLTAAGSARASLCGV